MPYLHYVLLEKADASHGMKHTLLIFRIVKAQMTEEHVESA